MVTHTQNECPAFIPSKVHLHSSEHTHTVNTHPGLCGARGAVGGSVSCSRAPQSWYWGWRERCTFTPPTYNSCQPETQTHNLWVMSPTLTIRPQLPHKKHLAFRDDYIIIIIIILYNLYIIDLIHCSHFNLIFIFNLYFLN